MHRTLHVAALALLTACADAAAPNAHENAAATAAPSVAQATGGGAQVTMQQQLIEENYVLDRPGVLACSGEPISITARTRIVLQQVIIPGERFHGTFHMTEQGSSGVGMDTGLPYRFVQSQSESVRIEGELPYTGNAIFDRRVISQGSAPNFQLHNVFHFTINGNGELVVDRNEISRVCL